MQSSREFDEIYGSFLQKKICMHTQVQFYYQFKWMCWSSTIDLKVKHSSSRKWGTIKPSGASQVARGKESSCQCKTCRFNPWVGKIPWRRKWQPTPVFFPGISHGWQSLAGSSPKCCRELDKVEHAHAPLTHGSEFQNRSHRSNMDMRRNQGRF